jgi:hypothetical protein
MDRTVTTRVEGSVNRDAVLQFVLIMFFLQRSRSSVTEENSPTFSLAPIKDLQAWGFSPNTKFGATSGFS